jgi:hypothetical protein
MNSSELHADNTMRLLDMVIDLYGDDKSYPRQNLPYSTEEDGSIILSEILMTELNKEGNSDLIPWAQENIASLFE